MCVYEVSKHYLPFLLCIQNKPHIVVIVLPVCHTVSVPTCKYAYMYFLQMIALQQVLLLKQARESYLFILFKTMSAMYTCQKA